MYERNFRTEQKLGYKGNWVSYSNKTGNIETIKLSTQANKIYKPRHVGTVLLPMLCLREICVLSAYPRKFNSKTLSWMFKM